MAEIELFASALAPFGIRPIFFSGCPVACEQAGAVIDNIALYPIDKKAGAERFDVESWRSGLAQTAVESLANDLSVPYQPDGPMQALVTMRDGEATAPKIANRWKLDYQNDQILIKAAHIRELYMALIQICYLTPLVEKILPACLFAYNLWGRLGLAWVRRQIKNKLIQELRD